MRPSYDITWKELLSKIQSGIKQTGNVSIACGNDLYVRIIGNKRSVFWYKRDKDRKFIKLANFTDYTLANIRKLLKKDDTTKFDPNAVLFSKISQKWLDTKKDLKRYVNIKRYVDILSCLDDYKVIDLTVSNVKEELLKQEVSAYQLRESISTLCSIMDFAIEENIISSHNFQILKKSPSFKKHVRGEGYKWLPVSEFEKLYSRLLYLDNEYLFYFMLLPMTCLRPGECRQLKVEYFDLEKRILSVPGEIMKVKSPYPFRIPLTDQTVKLFNLILDNNRSAIEKFGYLFPKKNSIGGKEGPVASNFFSVAWSHSIKDANMHGFRKSARTWMAEHEISLEVAAKCLDHTLPTGADIFYQKSDLLEKRRPVMEQWNKEIYDNLPKDLKRFFN